MPCGLLKLSAGDAVVLSQRRKKRAVWHLFPDSLAAGHQNVYARAHAEYTEEADAFKAACAVFLHGCGGDKAALQKGRHGMKAWDIAEGAAEVLKDLWNVTEE